MNKRDYILFAIVSILIIMLLFKSCQLKRDRDNLLDQVSSYQLGEKHFKETIKKDSSTIVEQSQTILTQQEAMKLGLLKLEGQIKDVQSQVTEKQKLIIQKVNVPYIPDNYVDTAIWMQRIKAGEVSKPLIDSLISHSVIVPKDFKTEQKWYSIYGKVKKSGILMDSLKISNESSVTIGYKKSGFLNLGRTPIVEIKNTNPYLSVEQMNNIVVKKNKGIFQSRIFWAGVGLLGGLIIQKF